MNPPANSSQVGAARRGRANSTFRTEHAYQQPQILQGQSSSSDLWSAPARHVDNGTRAMRKRHSFFGRSNSDAVSKGGMPTLHSTMSSQSRQQPPSRPGTAMSETRRRATEPLQHIRNSIFGERKRTSPPNSREGLSRNPSRTESRNGHGGSREGMLPREHFRTEQDYYQYLRKSSISPPFHFEHVTHTLHKDLPPLATVDETELTKQFWGASAYQRPRRHLNGIKADDLVDKLPAMGVQRGAPSSRPTSPTPEMSEPPNDRSWLPAPRAMETSIDETLFDEVSETRFDPDAALREMHNGRQSVKHPRRQSSLGFLNEQRLQFLSDAVEPGTQPSADPLVQRYSIYREPELPRQPPQRISPNTNEPSDPLGSVQEESGGTSSRRASSQIDRSRQPLPPVPGERVLKKGSRGSMRPPNPSTASVSSVASSDYRSSEHRSSVKSKRSSRSTYKSQATPATSNFTTPSEANVRLESLLSDATWEDDVEFCYQQEAESTCNFDWQGVTPIRESVIAPSIAESDGGGVRLSAWVQSSPQSGVSSRRSSRQDSVAFSPAQKASRDLHAQHNRVSRDVQQVQHQRAHSVGHRGFLAARKGSVDNVRQKYLVPPILEVTPSSTQPSILSPVFSVAGTDEEAAKTPFSPKSLHFHGFDGVQRISAEYLSDPESHVTSESKHTKSSSFGSYESAARPNSSATGEKARWSVASSSSVPELLHAKRRSKQSLRKSIISRPLESLPQSPTKQESARDEEESPFVPRASQVEPMRNTFIMRRPQSVKDTQAMQAAGRMVQRGRPSTPSRFSRLLAVEEGRQMADSEAPDWI